MGLPLTQLAIRRFGLRGVLVVEAACGGLLVRDVAMIAAGAPSRLRRGPATLLRLEAAAAAAAVLTCFRPLLDPDARERAARRRPDPWVGPNQKRWVPQPGKEGPGSA
jgi:hypothetical protein